MRLRQHLFPILLGFVVTASTAAVVLQAQGLHFFVNGFDENGTPATKEMFACPAAIPGPPGVAGPMGPVGPKGDPGQAASVTLNAVVDLLASLNPDTFPPTAIQTIAPFVAGTPGRPMVFAGGTFTVTAPVILTLVAGDDAACSVNYRELTTPVPAWPNQQAALPWRRVLAGMSVCLKVSAPATVGGTYTVLR